MSTKILGTFLSNINYPLFGDGFDHVRPRAVALSVHESGHAILAASVGYRVVGVTIDLCGGRSGICLYYFPPAPADEPGRQAFGAEFAQVAVAGAVACGFLDSPIVAMSGHDTLLSGDRFDVGLAFTIAGHPAAERAAFEQRAESAAAAVLRRHREALDRLAVALLRERSLDEADVVAILGDDLAGRWRTRAASAPARSAPRPPTVTPGRRGYRGGLPQLRYSDAAPITVTRGR